MKKLFTVESSNEGENGSYCNKLITETVITRETGFGMVTDNHKETYYLFTTTQNQVGKEAELDMSHFRVYEKPYAFRGDDGNMVHATLKYLKPIQ